jgi:RNA polymerase sigma factor (sigma-70 family)
MGELGAPTLRHGLPGESDEQLTARARRGDESAFGELYRRHRKAAESTAWCLLRSKSDADDVVSDAFTGVLSALRNGRGPRDNFRRYLLACVRNGCRKRRPRTVTVSDDRLERMSANERPDRPAPVVEDPERYVEADTVARAFASLSPRWQHTLWLTEVEQRSAHEVSECMQLTPNATAALAHRARQAFAVAYLAEHVGAVAGKECARTAPLLAGYVRGQLAAEPLLEVERHLVRCSTCAKAAADLRDVNASLRSLIGPLAAASSGVTMLSKAAGTTVTSMSGVSLSGASAGMTGGLLIKGLAAVLLIAPTISSDGPAESRVDAAAGLPATPGAVVETVIGPDPMSALTVAQPASAAVTGGGPDGAPATEVQPTTPAAAGSDGRAAVDRPAAPIDVPDLGDVPAGLDETLGDSGPPISAIVTPALLGIQPVTEPVVQTLDQALDAMGLGSTAQTVRLVAALVPMLDPSLVELLVDGVLGSAGAGESIAAPLTAPTPGSPGAGAIAVEIAGTATGPAAASAPAVVAAVSVPSALPLIVAPTVAANAPSIVAPAGLPAISVPALELPAISVPPLELAQINLPAVALPAVAGVLPATVVTVPPLELPGTVLPGISVPAPELLGLALPAVTH